MTVTVSVKGPSASVASTVAVNDPIRSTPSRWDGRQPASVNRTSYTPGRRFSMRYRPWPSVTVERVFSMSAGLLASTMTPGTTAPDESLTEPAIAAWASASAEAPAQTTITSINGFILRLGHRLERDALTS